MSKEIIKDTNWRGVPCTLRYNNSLKPVCVGDKFDSLEVVGGAAPHKPGSSGYMHYTGGQRYYVNGAHWVEDYEPNAWAAMCRRKKKGRKAASDWEKVSTFSIPYYGEDKARLMAHGRARLIEYNPDMECHVKATRETQFD
jgi:hypothetical protein